jgi:2,4-dienoyl-CoA reductase-like NADH-dependent reductase (Old Yellow Enzyme family)
MKEHTQPHSSQSKTSELLHRLENEEFDLVAVGRALLADPHWFKKMKEGKTAEISPFTPESLKTLY